MTLVVEDWSGVDDANGYITVAFFRSYHDARGNDYATIINGADTAAEDDAIGQAIIKATDYMEIIYGDRWKGVVATEATTLQFPRSYMYDRKGDLVQDWPADIQKACAEYTFRALSGELMPDPVVLDDTNQLIKMKEETVGPITEKTEYSVGAFKNVRSYPEADRLLRFWLKGFGGVIR